MKRRKTSNNENEKVKNKNKKTIISTGNNSENDCIDLKSYVIVSEKEMRNLKVQVDFKMPDDDETLMRKNKRKNMFILIFLYFLQGLPLGLTGAIPLLMSSKKVSYSSQGTFSFAFWPFSIKLLWAPIVDAIYLKSFGRRKSWIIPIQILLGIYLILFANPVKEYLSENNQQSDFVYKLTGIFFLFTFMAATQDIAVDGWGLSMFAKEDLSCASLSESIGKTTGWFIGNVLFLVFESKDFSNGYIRHYFDLPKQDYGILTIDQFMVGFGIVYILSTLYILVFVKELKQFKLNKPNESNEKDVCYEDNLTVLGTYKLIWSIIKLKPMIYLMLILLTFRIGFSTRSTSYLKLIEAGVSKETLGLMALPLTPIEIMIPLLVNRFISRTTKSNPFKYFTHSFILKLFTSLIVSFWVFLTPYFKIKSDDNRYEFTFIYYFISFIIQVLNSFFGYALFVPFSWFFSSISDKTIGGTYLTFLNTLFNLGANWTTTASLYLMELLKFDYCFAQNADIDLKSILCSTKNGTKACAEAGGTCQNWIDPFYLQSLSCFLIGLLWIALFKNVLQRLAKEPDNSWKLFLKPKKLD